MILVTEYDTLKPRPVLVSRTQVETIRPASVGKKFEAVITLRSGREITTATSFTDLVKLFTR